MLEYIRRYEQKSAYPPLTYKKFEYLGGGQKGAVHRVRAVGEDDRARYTGSFALKEYRLRDYAAQVTHDKKVHSYLAANGFIVPEVYVPVQEGILMTDLTNEGKNLVVSVNSNAPYIQRHAQQKPELLRLFETVNMDTVKDEYLPEVQRATSLGIEFRSGGCWFLILSNENKPSVVYVDYDEVKIRRNRRVSNLQNLAYFGEFFDWMRGIQEVLR